MEHNITNMDISENALKCYVKPSKKEGKALYKQGEAVCVMYDDDTHEWVGENDILKMEDGEILAEIADDNLQSHNINVFGYETQHFDYSEHAKEMFEEAILKVEDSEIKKDALANAAKHLDSILLKAKERNEIGNSLVEKQDIKILVADIQLFSYNNYKSGLEISIDLISNICSEILEFEDEFVGEKVFEMGGEIADSNNEMLQSQLKAVEHHAKELSSIINDNTPVEAWVVGKIERASTDLSDITHYLDGQKFEMGGVIDENWGNDGSTASNNEDYNNLYAMYPDNHTEAKRIWEQLSEEQKKGFIYDLDVTDAASEHISDSFLEFVNANSYEDWLENSTNWDEEEYAKGGEISEYVIVKGYDHFKDKPLYHVISKSNDYVGEWHTNREDAEEELKSLTKESGGEMKWGGRVTFKEKVEAITKSLNGRKVKPKYKKEYGNTYDKKEAKQAATKIVGAMVSKGKMADGGMMAKGGDIKSWEDKMKKRKDIEFLRIEKKEALPNGKLMIYYKYNTLNPNDTTKVGTEVLYADGGMMAKGGEIVDIEKEKKALIAKAKKSGIYEDFGQTEVRKLEDKYGYTQNVKMFDDWCMNFDKSQYEQGGKVTFADKVKAIEDKGKMAKGGNVSQIKRLKKTIADYEKLTETANSTLAKKHSRTIVNRLTKELNELEIKK